jgi:Heterokaryon incompatibility protein (HET)
MMRQIYSRAEKVLAWVGPTFGANPFLETHLAASLHYYGVVVPTLQTKLPDSIFVVADERVFFNLKYWTRVWIIQELTVASKVTVLYADLEVECGDLVSILRMLDDSPVGAGHLLKFRDHWIDSNKPISLLQALTWNLHTKVTDLRGKLYFHANSLFTFMGAGGSESTL